jgi:hypothetical protein
MILGDIAVDIMNHVQSNGGFKNGRVFYGSHNTSVKAGIN